MAKIKSRITSKAPKMVKAPYIGSYLEGQNTMGKVFNPSLRKVANHGALDLNQDHMSI